MKKIINILIVCVLLLKGYDLFIIGKNRVEAYNAEYPSLSTTSKDNEIKKLLEDKQYWVTFTRFNSESIDKENAEINDIYQFKNNKVSDISVSTYHQKSNLCTGGPEEGTGITYSDLLKENLYKKMAFELENFHNYSILRNDKYYKFSTVYYSFLSKDTYDYSMKLKLNKKDKQIYFSCTSKNYINFNDKTEKYEQYTIYIMPIK